MSLCSKCMAFWKIDYCPVKLWLDSSQLFKSLGTLNRGTYIRLIYYTLWTEQHIQSNLLSEVYRKHQKHFSAWNFVKMGLVVWYAPRQQCAEVGGVPIPLYLYFLVYVNSLTLYLKWPKNQQNILKYLSFATLGTNLWWKMAEL